MTMIYLDHAATTPIAKEVMATMTAWAENKDAFGNPSSVHHFGRRARRDLDDARRSIAQTIQAEEKEIIFTSGGTEANNLAVIGTALANKDKGNHIITSKQEHHAVLRAAEYLEKKGFEVTYLPVNNEGIVRIEDVKAALTNRTILVSLMAVNNETGIVQPVQEIGSMLKNHQAFFHTDAVQAFGLLKLNVLQLGVDLLTVSAHKINGPKGMGFLYAASHVPISPIQFGGEQERKKRAGTENTMGVLGLRKAVEIVMDEREYRYQKYSSYKKEFVRVLTEKKVRFQINGTINNTVPSIINISFPNTDVQALLTNFDIEGVAASSGSACTAGAIEPSHVLTAMYGANDERAINSIRFSFGLMNSKENISAAANIVASVVNRLTNQKG
ncbi:cysteine desulfurase family protein [Virgibacillus sp. W0430]|uniref:cysteine desulfurase family protein n=1 Tax=Virgibacillus sp. W0430 TaxID=3391580 RepID=UPI003F450A02